jgi:hypothetical protein
MKRTWKSSIATGFGPVEKNAAFSACSPLAGQTISGIPCVSDSDREL